MLRSSDTLPKMTTGVKKWTTLFTMACFFLAGGIEYSVVFPTMWAYVESKNGEEWFYGLSLAAFSISNLITAPLYGLFFDKTHKTKFIVLFANLFEIGGNFMYMAATSKYMILGSRFIVGTGAGAGAILFGDLARTYRKKERTMVYSIFMGMRQIGLIIGPAFNLFLRECNFSVGPFKIDKLTVPGGFMMVVWLIVEMLFLFCFFSLPVLDEASSSLAHSLKKPSASINQTPPLVHKSSHHVQSVNEKTHLLQSNNGPSLPPSPHSGKVEVRKGCWASLSWRIYTLLREETVVLLAVLFITIFNQTAIEAMFVPMSDRLLHWKEKEVSIFFSGAGAVIIVAFILVTVISRYVKDRWQILGGLLFEVCGYSWLIGWISTATDETPWVLWRVLVGSFLCIFGLPFFMVTSASLYSKLLPSEIQGFGQGIRRSVFSVAAILGPLWAGGSVAAFSNYYILLGVPCGILLLVLVLVLSSFGRLNEPK